MTEGTATAWVVGVSIGGKKGMLIVKKYSNRRLYDTSESRYITLEELAQKIRKGEDAQVVDAKTGTDLTQATLAQIIIEGRGAGRLLPVPLLTQLIRMRDDALSEFFGQYVSMALQFYLQMRQVAPYYPLANAPFNAANAMARMFMGQNPWMQQPPAAPPQGGYGPWGGAQMGGMYGAPPWGAPPPGAMPPDEAHMAEAAAANAAAASAPPKDDLAALRQEIEALKKALQPGSDDD